MISVEYEPFSLALIRRATSFSQLIHGYRRNSMRFTDSRNWCPIWPPISKQQPSHFARGSRRSSPPPPPSFNAEKGKNTEKGKGWGRKETWIEDDTTPLIPSHVKQKMVFLFLFSYLDFKKSAPPNQCRCPLDVLTQTTPLTIITGMDIKGFISLHATVTTVPAYNSRRDQ